jgi:hypothetical protein
MLEIDVTLRQPLSIGTTAANMRRATQRFVPGSAVRGAYAARWLAEHGDYQDSPQLRRRFIDIFERVDVRFGPLFAEGGQPGSLATLRHKYTADAGCAQASWNAAVDPATALVSRCPDCAASSSNRAAETSMEWPPPNGSESLSTTTRPPCRESCSPANPSPPE